MKTFLGLIILPLILIVVLIYELYIPYKTSGTVVGVSTYYGVFVGDKELYANVKLGNPKTKFEQESISVTKLHISTSAVYDKVLSAVDSKKPVSITYRGGELLDIEKM